MIGIILHSERRIRWYIGREGIYSMRTGRGLRIRCLFLCLCMRGPVCCRRRAGLLLGIGGGGRTSLLFTIVTRCKMPIPSLTPIQTLAPAITIITIADPLTKTLAATITLIAITLIIITLAIMPVTVEKLRISIQMKSVPIAKNKSRNRNEDTNKKMPWISS